MKFLIDAQLPTKLVGWLTTRGHEARHVVGLPNGLRMPDAEIWQHAATEGFTIVTKDKDFVDLASVRGAPPVVLLIGLGNVSTSDLLRLLDDAWEALTVELDRPHAGVVTLERQRIVVLQRA